MAQRTQVQLPSPIVRVLTIICNSNSYTHTYVYKITNRNNWKILGLPYVLEYSHTVSFNNFSDI